MPLIVGLTGGIGSGKSAAEKYFADLGVAVVDTDVIAHGLTGPGGPAMPALAAAFGPSVLAADGSLDRAATRVLVFAEPAARKRLEAILHPMIRDESERRCRQALEGGAPYVILTVPLLIESGDYRQRVDRVLVVDCDDEVRIARIAARSRLSRDEIERIMAAQCSRAERLTAADDIIENNGTPDRLAAQVEKLHRQYLELAAGNGPGGNRQTRE
jgi:dephospho-CoA kinase